MGNLRTPKDLKPIYKYNGEELNGDDFRFLYNDSPEPCNFWTIAYLFNVRIGHIYFISRKFNIHVRTEDSHAMNDAHRMVKEKQKKYEKEYYKKQNEQDRLLWEEAVMLYGKPRPTQTYVVNGRFRLDKGIQMSYFRGVRDVFKSLKYKPSSKKEVKLIRNVDLSAMRLHRGLDMFAFSKSSGIPYKNVVYYEKTANVIIPKEVSDIYFKVLNISKLEFNRILEVLAGKRNTMFQEDSRNIPESVRDYIWERDKGKCRSCSETRYLHLHHIKKFSEGGKHEARNLKLLCVTCHAEAHFGEPGYHMLKSQVKKLMG